MLNFTLKDEEIAISCINIDNIEDNPLDSLIETKGFCAKGILKKIGVPQVANVFWIVYLGYILYFEELAELANLWEFY